MSYTDKNRIFFGLFHYILSEQSNVNWALKTSLVNFTGLNETINQRQYKNDSISNDIIKYVKDIKPYHVQFDNYIEKYSSKDDVCNILPSDSIFQTIKVRYDAVSTKPDIKDTVYTYTLSGEPTKLKSSNDIIKYLDIELKTIFIRKKDFRGDWFWEVYSSVEDGDLIFIESENKIKKFTYIVNKDNFGYYDLVELTDKELVNFENTTAANRLFLYKTHDLDLIKDYLNAHFKGLTIDGGDFNIDRFGYDAFLYDLKRYEEPVKTSGYCFIDPTYNQINVGDNTFKINSEHTLSKEYLTITSSIKGEIIDYFLDTSINQITLFYETQINEIITIIDAQNNKTYHYITNTFSESDDESYTRKFYDINNVNEDNEYKLSIPYSPIKINKLVVDFEKPNGYRKPLTNYKIDGDFIIIPKTSDFVINSKIYISIADYSLIYDKIYTWEDVYGVANNKAAWDNYCRNSGLMENNYGGQFLNPYYEENRPSELSAIYPQNTLTIYTSKANAVPDDYSGKISFSAKKLFYFDFKNKQLNYNIIKSAKLVNDFTLGDTEIVANKDIFEKPYYLKNDTKLYPGKVFINGELIEYFEYIVNENNVILKKLRRGCNGTFINNGTYEAGTIIYPLYNEKEYNYEITPSYYYIKTNDMKKFTINGDVLLDNLIKVYKTTNIKLLSEITPKTKSFTISSNTINLPEYDENSKLIKKGFFFIGDDKIEFKNITKNGNVYKITNFDLPIGKTYDVGTNISSIKYEEVNASNYIIDKEKYESQEHLENGKMRNFVLFPEALNKGECLIIENHNKNVFN